MSTRPFLTARWEHLLMASFAIDPAILAPDVPAGTELDLFEGRAYASLVGLRFRNTRLLGVGFPLHRRFDEVNLRFYVRRRTNEGWNRATVFAKEIVARPAIAAIARLTYNEPYVAYPMRSTVAALRVSYAWRRNGRWERLEALRSSEAALPQRGSFEAYVADRSHGYTRQRDGRTLEYHVAHPGWRIAPATDFVFDADVATLYGERFVAALRASPRAVFVAEGSGVSIAPGILLGGTSIS